MLPLAVARVVIWELFEELYISRQTNADVNSLNEVVTQQSLFGKTPGQDFVEGLDVVNALAVIDRFAEDILVKIGNRLAIRIHAARIGEQPCKTRRRSGGQSDTDARLDNRVTANAQALIL